MAKEFGNDYCLHCSWLSKRDWGNFRLDRTKQMTREREERRHD